MFMCVNISYQFFKRKNVKKSLCFLKRRVLHLYVLTCFFHKIQGNGGAREASPIVILFNLLRPKSKLNGIYHCNIKGLLVREIVRIENMISQVKFC